MIVHQTPSMAPPIKPATHLRKYLQPSQPVFIIMIDIFSAITS